MNMDDALRCFDEFFATGGDPFASFSEFKSGGRTRVVTTTRTVGSTRSFYVAPRDDFEAEERAAVDEALRISMRDY